MTSASDPAPETLEEEVRSVKKAFEVLLLAIEAEGIESATEIAGRIMDRMDHIVQELKHGYVQKILDEKFRPFMDDRQRFAQYKSTEGKRKSEEFIEIVSRLEKHIGSIDREVRLLIPQEPAVFGWYRRNRKGLGITAASIVVVALGWAGVERFLTRGKGLMGEYYSGVNFRKLENRRRDLKIDFTLRNQAPIRRLGWENFSVRWTGFLRIPVDGTYEFVTRSDDGVRLYINDQRVIDNWTVHRATADKVTVELQSGMVPVKLEWFQRRGPASMQLHWRTPGDAQPRIIEPEYLAPKID